MLNWLKSEQRKRRKKIRLDRIHLEARARRFLTGYLSADEADGKAQYYRAVDEISRKCQPPVIIAQNSLDDSQIAEAASVAAMRMVSILSEGLSKKGQPDFLTDAFATVAIAYHRAAGVYVDDDKMRELGTAAVHLLTMATSYISAQRDQKMSNQNSLFGQEPGTS